MINKNYKTYILCPAYVETGGPESLHLLCHTLRNKNIECYMVYTNEGPYKKGHPGHGVIDSSPEWMDHIILNGKPNGYQQYNTISTIEIEDSPNNTIIIPEIYLNAANKFNHITKFIWWLASRILPDGSYKQNEWFDFSKNREIKHLYNSKFAEHMLLQLNASQYFELKTFVNENIQSTNIEKENIICFNPKKGYEYTSKIIQQLNSKFQFVPIQNMTANQIQNILSRSKLYIDFGHHPGRERLPREAALCNCCVISSFVGSAMFFEDMPIPESYKFEKTLDNINTICNLIESIMSDYLGHMKNFYYYKNILNNNKKQFDLNVENLII